MLDISNTNKFEPIEIFLMRLCDIKWRLKRILLKYKLW